MLVNIFGKRGSGKTTMIKGAIGFCEAPVVIIDILGNFVDIPGAYQTESVSDTIAHIERYHMQDENETVPDPLEFKDEIESVIVLQPPDPDEAVDFISAALWHAEGGTLVLDEADGFDIYSAPCFDQLIRYGRNRGVHLLTGCRRPAELSRNITAGANKIFIFQTQEPRDIEYFAKTILGKEQAERLISMPSYHGIFIDYDKKTIGDFKTDEHGNVFILTETTIRQ